MGINIGAFIAPLITGFLAQSPWFKETLASHGFDPVKSWHWGFAAAGVGMTFAMLIFARNAVILNEPAAGDNREMTRDVLRHGAIAVAITLLLLSLALVSDIDGYANLRWLFLLVPVAGIIVGARQSSEDAQRLAAVGVLFIASMIFWAIFEQAGTTIALFADKLTRTDVFGTRFPSSWFQSVNPIFVILLAPAFASLWIWWGARQPSPAIKFAFGLLFLSSSFLLMVPAAKMAASGAVSPLWLIGLFFLQTVGELLLSPVGLSTMTKLAPQRMTGLVLGVWFLAAAFGNKLAGVLGGGFTSEDPNALVSAFLTESCLVAIAAGLLFLAAPWVKRLSQNAD
jgi:POT family proton-dependent oligopeptide transporter